MMPFPLMLSQRPWLSLNGHYGVHHGEDEFQYNLGCHIFGTAADKASIIIQQQKNIVSFPVTVTAKHMTLNDLGRPCYVKISFLLWFA